MRRLRVWIGIGLFVLAATSIDLPVPRGVRVVQYASAQTRVGGQVAEDAVGLAPWITDGVATLDFPSNFTVGNCVCTGFGINRTDRTITGVADNDSGDTNVYTERATLESAGNAMEVWAYCAKINEVADIVSISMAATSTNGVAFGVEYTGQNATDSASCTGNTSTNAVTAAGLNHSTGTVNITGSSMLLFGFTYGSTGSYTVASGFSQINNTTIDVSGDQAGLTGNTAMVNTSAANETSMNVGIEIRPAVGAGTPTRMTLLGVGHAR
jgi:hypothetical protein